MPFIDLNPGSRNPAASTTAPSAGAAPVPTPGANPAATPAPLPPLPTDSSASATPTPVVSEPADTAPVVEEKIVQPEALPVDLGLSQIASDYIDPEITEAAPAPAAAAPTPAPTPIADSLPNLDISNLMPVEATAPAAPTSFDFSSKLDSELANNQAVPAAPSIALSSDAQVNAQPEGIVELKGPEFASSADAPQSKLTEALTGSLEERLSKAAESMPELPEPIVADAPMITPVPAYDPVQSLQLNTSGTPEPTPEVNVEVPAELPVLEAPKPLPTPPQPTAKRWKPNLPSLDAVEKELETPKSEPKPAVVESELPPVSSLVEVEEFKNAKNSNIDLKAVLKATLDKQASDLHLSLGYSPMIRVDGKLEPLQLPALNNADLKTAVSEVIKGRSDTNIDELMDLDLAYTLPGTQNRFRVNIFRQQESLAVVFRVIPNIIRTVEELRLPPVVKNFSKFAQGLVLVTGPTGSGKSTTLAAMINEINQRDPLHIVTIEDPIEFIYPRGKALVDQRTVYNDTESWSNALRAVLRQDPNVVLVGEMRDLETISSAIRVAETGHLVFATLHTNSASQSIDRIIDVFPEAQQSQIRIQLANVLMAVVSQRLMPISGGGRRVAAEVLVATSAVRSAIRDNKVYQIDNMIQTSAELGMMTLEKSLAAMVREGLVPVEVAQTYANRPDDLLTLLSHR